ncbi:MAG: DUF4845 domain-containing protein [Gallionellaceae bacterium]
MKIRKNKQQGIGFAGIFLIIGAIIITATLALKVIPAYWNYSDINRLFKVIASDPAMKTASVREIRESFSKRALMDSVSTITAADIRIDKSEGPLVLSTSYVVKVPLVGNASLMLEFNPSSAQ